MYDTLTLSEKQLKNLTPYDIGHKEHNSESQIFILDQGSWNCSNGNFLLKKIYRSDTPSFYIKQFNIKSLSCNERLQQIEELVIPEHIVLVDGKMVGFTVPRVYDSTCLGVILKNPKIDNEKKIEYLAKVGKLLKKIKAVNQVEDEFQFAFGDLHEYNFLIDERNGNLKAIDLDSVYLGTNYPAPSYYLNTSKNVLYFPNKYKPKILDEKILKSEESFKQIVTEYGTDKISYIIYPDENSDLFCYNMMILNNLIARDKISKASLPKYFEYINYLESLGFGKDIIRSFSNLYTDADNINPVDYLDQIPTDKIGEAGLTVFELKKKKKLI